MSDKADLQKHSNRVTESVTCAVQGEMTNIAALFSRCCLLIGATLLSVFVFPLYYGLFGSISDCLNVLGSI